GMVLDPTLNTPKQPLALNAYLVSSARGQSQYLADSFYYSTTGKAGSTPEQRMAEAGYTLAAGAVTGENIDFEYSFNPTDTLTGITRTAYEDEFKNYGLAERSGGRFGNSRDNFLDPAFREVGAGLGIGLAGTSSYTSLVFTQDFAASGSGLFITGVAF